MSRNRGERKDVLRHEVKTRVNEQKFKELTTLLAKTHHRTMSELVRNILYNRPIKTYIIDETFSKVMEEISGVRKELNSIGININQVTRNFNASSNPAQKLMLSFNIAEHYKAVVAKVGALVILISKLADKWLQE